MTNDHDSRADERKRSRTMCSHDHSRGILVPSFINTLTVPALPQVSKRFDTHVTAQLGRRLFRPTSLNEIDGTPSTRDEADELDEAQRQVRATRAAALRVLSLRAPTKLDGLLGPLRALESSADDCVALADPQLVGLHYFAWAVADA